MGTSESGFHIYRNGILDRIGPADEQEWAYHVSLIRADYERCHPEDTFEDLLQRARFSKEDRGLLSEWMAEAARRAEAAQGDREQPKGLRESA